MFPYPLTYLSKPSHEKSIAAERSKHEKTVFVLACMLYAHLLSYIIMFQANLSVQIYSV